MNTSKLAEALWETEVLQMNSLPSDEELSDLHQFSPQFEAKMGRLVRKMDKKYYFFRGFQVRKAAVATVFLFLLLGAPMTVEAIRTPVVNFFIEVFATFSRLQFAEANAALPETILEVYHPEVPDGYEMTKEVNLEVLYRAYYTNSNGNMIRFQQFTLGQLQALWTLKIRPWNQ